MITNERQYGISKAELQRFEGAVGKYMPGEEVDPRMREVMDDALRGQAETLRDEIKHYEDLRDGRINERELGSLRDLPTALIEARIAAGLTQKALGERLEVKEQQSSAGRQTSTQAWESIACRRLPMRSAWESARRSVTPPPLRHLRGRGRIQCPPSAAGLGRADRL